MKNIKSKILLVSVAIMVAVTTLVASYTPINWGYFALSVIVLAILIWLQKIELKKSLTNKANSELSLSNFNKTLNNILIKLRDISKKEINENYSNELLFIIDNSMPNIDEYKNSMINELGIANYTQIIIPFAKAERLINRGVSATIDGYNKESKKCISDSLSFIKLSIDEIKKIEVSSNG